MTTQSFESSLARLEEIVRQLDNGQQDLQQSLQCYEEGIHLLAHCQSTLEGAKQRIYVLRGLDEQGNPLLEEENKEKFQSDSTVTGRQTTTGKKGNSRPKKIPADEQSSEDQPLDDEWSLR